MRSCAVRTLGSRWWSIDYAIIIYYFISPGISFVALTPTAEVPDAPPNVCCLRIKASTQDNPNTVYMACPVPQDALGFDCRFHGRWRLKWDLFLVTAFRKSICVAKGAQSIPAVTGRTQRGA